MTEQVKDMLRTGKEVKASNHNFGDHAWFREKKLFVEVTGAALIALVAAPEAPTASLTAATPAGQTCSEAAGPHTIKVGLRTYTAPCRWFFRRGHCSADGVREECPISCGECALPGCEDDEEYSVDTVQGELDCEDWRKFDCWEEVKSHCPTACEVNQCVR